MKSLALCVALLALFYGSATAQNVTLGSVPRFILPWDIPSSYVIEAVVGPSCIKYDFYNNNTVEQVQVFIVQAMVRAPADSDVSPDVTLCMC